MTQHSEEQRLREIIAEIKKFDESTPSKEGEEEAVEFAEWMRRNLYEPVGDVWMRSYTEGTGATWLTSDLYSLFKQSKGK